MNSLEHTAHKNVKISDFIGSDWLAFLGVLISLSKNKVLFSMDQAAIKMDSEERLDKKLPFYV